MSVEFYRKKIIDLRAALEKEKANKKKDNEYYADLIKRSSVASTKASYRKSKIDKAAAHDRAIESLKRQIEQAKDSLAWERKRK